MKTMSQDTKCQISIIVPVLNEADNVVGLVERFDSACKIANISYEVIFVDDNSTDDTVRVINLDLIDKYPVKLFPKKGNAGKAYSILEGFEHAKYDYVAMIDADLQYPPEAIPRMVELLTQNQADIVVANRVARDTSILRKIASKGFDFVFAKMLHDMHVDVQSGLKVFRRQVMEEIQITPSPWTFDLEFLLKARNYGYVIKGHDIYFAERTKGISKIKFWTAVWEIGTNALQLKFKQQNPLRFNPKTEPGMVGAGMAHNQKRFITHSTLHYSFSAIDTFTAFQKTVFGLSLLVFVLFLLFYPISTAIVFVGILSSLYFVDVFFNLYLVLRSLKTPPEIIIPQKELQNLTDKDLPIYTILCPLYKEAHILPGFVKAIDNLDWPKNKLDVLLLLEEDDQETIEVAENMDLPEAFRILVVPHSMPKTKPKACNYGLNFAKGEYVVIYDAEDIPEPLQLKKAYWGFQTLPSDIKCLQAKLNYFNPRHNLLTRLFTAEYSLWFEISLPGLQSVNTSIPLGGTSNHFRTKDLLELEGWDPFNVTEDCDLGIRIFKKGYRTAIIDSVTLEEANSSLKNWIRQRSRWIKGYMQTYLVHMRNPVKFFKENGGHAFLFQLVVGGKLAFIFINPFLWLMTISYFVFYDQVGLFIEQLYPNMVFYMAVISLVFGNFLAMYYYMLGCAKRGHWFLVKYVFFVPIYWLMVSVAGLMALYQLFVKPHYWEKTNHGLHIKKDKDKKLKKDKTPKNKDGQAGTKTQKIKMVQDILRPPAISKILPIRYTRADNISSIQTYTPKSTTKTKNSSDKKSFFGSLIQKVLSPEAIFLEILLISNFLNFAFNAFLGRYLAFEEFAVVSFVNTLWYLTTIFLGAFAVVVNHKTAYENGKKTTHDIPTLNWLNYCLRSAMKFLWVMLLLWMLLSWWIAQYFQVDILVLFLFSPAFFFGILSLGGRGYIQGYSRFVLTGVLMLAETILKLLLAIGLVFGGFGNLAYLAIPYSVVLSGILVWFFVRKNLSLQVPFEILQKNFQFPTKFYLAALLGSLGTILFLNLDILLVKHYFEADIAGQYALLALIGKMIFFFGTLPSALLITLVSKAEGANKSTTDIFWGIYSLTLLIVGGAVMTLIVAGDWIVPMLFGQKARVILPYIDMYSIGFGFLTLASVVVTYQLALKRYIFQWVTPLMAIVMGILIVLDHNTLSDMAFYVALAGFLTWITVQNMHFLVGHIEFVIRGLQDFVDAFWGRIPETNLYSEEKQRILIFNWRDKKHKHAGGAEEYTHEISKEWVKQGNHVTLFCGNDGYNPRYERLDGVDIIRRGGFYLVYIWAFVYYIFRFKNKYDIIVDCQNGIPFFTPLYINKPVYCLMHHVHQEVFDRELPRPMAQFAKFLEKDMMAKVYKDIRFITVSDSSKDEIKNLGLGQAGIDIVHPGVENAYFDKHIITKSSVPTVLYLGRLKAYKSVDVLIQSFGKVLEQVPEAVLVIAGTGDEYKNLKDLTKKLKIPKHNIVFKGFVSEKEKVRLLKSSWVMVNPSYKEGWGIVAIEANACGTPTIASDVAGLRDSVKDGYSGFLVPYGDVEVLSKKIADVLQDRDLLKRLSDNAKQWATNFEWQKSGDRFLEILVEVDNL
jgi:cellulose synthase/poly-beta-1,6-N-acetylglucosamine synthase-like glycosyltransferase/glycosyltransferase involved in cell wall biosynthesis/O-antigen/teichoic acid export membrane protein